MYEAQPHAVWLTVNRDCNFRCKWCYAKGTGYGNTNEMSFVLAKKLASLCQEIGIKRLLIIGGEPMLWNPLIDFNAFCRDLGVETILVTNGVCFGDNNFWYGYKKNPNNRVGLSLKAATPKQLLEVVGKSNFDIVKRGIIRAIQELNTDVSITYNIFYAVNLKKLVSFAIECGARSVKIDFCSVTFLKGRPRANYMIDPRKLTENIVRDYPDLERITNGHIIFEMMMPFCLWPLEFITELKRKRQLLSVCHVLKRSGLIFDESGKIIICNTLFDYPIGSYGKEFDSGSSLLEWLNSSKITNYYRRLMCYPSPACKNCQWYSDCGGGCPLRWTFYRPEEFVRPVPNPLINQKRGEKC